MESYSATKEEEIMPLAATWTQPEMIMLSKASQSCPTLCDPVDCSQPGSSIHGIFQVRILEWVAIPCSRGSSWPRDRTQVSGIAGKLFTICASREDVKVSQTDRQLLYDITYMWNLIGRKWTNLWNRNRITDVESVAANGEGWRGSLGLADENYNT